MIVVNASEDASFEEELVQDVREIITVFSARLLWKSQSQEQRGTGCVEEGGERGSSVVVGLGGGKHSPLKRTTKYETLPLNRSKRPGATGSHTH